MITRIGRTALFCYTEITIVRDSISFFKWEEMAVEIKLSFKKVAVLQIKTPTSAFVCGHRPKTKELLELFFLLFSIRFISSLKGI